MRMPFASFMSERPALKIWDVQTTSPACVSPHCTVGVPDSSIYACSEQEDGLVRPPHNSCCEERYAEIDRGHACFAEVRVAAWVCLGGAEVGDGQGYLDGLALDAELLVVAPVGDLALPAGVHACFAVGPRALFFGRSGRYVPWSQAPTR